MTAAGAWAEAARCPSARAKNALKTLAAFADQEGYAWATMEVLMIGIESDIERTCQRALAELKGATDPANPGGPRIMANGQRALIEETPRSRWTLYKGRLIPVYRLVLEFGPRNMIERLREDRDAARRVTSVSPQAEPPGDPEVTPPGDFGDARPVTSVSPVYSKGQREAETESSTGVRAGEDVAVRADFDRAFSAYPESGRRGRSSRDGEAWPAWLAEIVRLAAGLGVSPAEASERLSLAILAACREPKALLGVSGQAKSFHDWLSLGRYDAWLGAGPAQPGRIQFAGPEALWLEVVDAKGEAFANGCLLAADFEDTTVYPATTYAAARLAEIAALLKSHGVTVGAVRRRSAA